MPLIGWLDRLTLEEFGRANPSAQVVDLNHDVSDLERIREIKKKVEGDLLKIPGVTGVDIGYKIVGGRKTADLAIRVYVESKRDVPTSELVPAKIEGIPTDVIERKFVLHVDQP